MATDVSDACKEAENTVLRAQHIPRIVRYLQSIYETESDIDRYLVIAIEEHPESYVQALFVEENPPFLLIEAASGFYAQPEGLPRRFEVSSTGKARLGELGFSLDDSDGNFQLKLYYDPDSALSDFQDAASVMVHALIGAYGLSLDSTITVEAPFAPEDEEE